MTEALVSSWGHANFEDDDALDYVDDLVHKITTQLDRATANRRLTGDVSCRFHDWGDRTCRGHRRMER